MPHHDYDGTRFQRDRFEDVSYQNYILDFLSRDKLVELIDLRQDQRIEYASEKLPRKNRDVLRNRFVLLTCRSEPVLPMTAVREPHHRIEAYCCVYNQSILPDLPLRDFADFALGRAGRC